MNGMKVIDKNKNRLSTRCVCICVLYLNVDCQMYESSEFHTDEVLSNVEDTEHGVLVYADKKRKRFAVKNSHAHKHKRTHSERDTDICV